MFGIFKKKVYFQHHLLGTFKKVFGNLWQRENYNFHGQEIDLNIHGDENRPYEKNVKQYIDFENDYKNRITAINNALLAEYRNYYLMLKKEGFEIKLPDQKKVNDIDKLFSLISINSSENISLDYGFYDSYDDTWFKVALTDEGIDVFYDFT